jgi:hypothetical protein
MIQPAPLVISKTLKIFTDSKTDLNRNLFFGQDTKDYLSILAAGLI